MAGLRFRVVPATKPRRRKRARTSWRRGLLVRLSGNGRDNAPLLDAVAAFPDRFRALAMVGYDCTDRELENLAQARVVGVRFNLSSYDPHALFRPDAPQLLARLKAFARFAQVFADEQWAAAAPALSEQCPRDGRSFSARATSGGDWTKRAANSCCSSDAMGGRSWAPWLPPAICRGHRNGSRSRVRARASRSAGTSCGCSYDGPEGHHSFNLVMQHFVDCLASGAVRDRARQQARDTEVGRTCVMRRHIAAAGGS